MKLTREKIGEICSLWLQRAMEASKEARVLRPEEIIEVVTSTLPDAPALTDEQLRIGLKGVLMKALITSRASVGPEVDTVVQQLMDVCARRSAAQAPIDAESAEGRAILGAPTSNTRQDYQEPHTAPTVPTCPHGKAIDVFCQYCSGWRAKNSAQSTQAPTVRSSEVEADVVEQIAIMLKEYGDPYTPMDSYRSEAKRLLAFFRAHFTAHPPEGWRTTEQIFELLKEGLSVQYWPNAASYAEWIHTHLAPPKSTPQERVTVIEDAKWCRVFLDGGKKFSFEQQPNKKEFGEDASTHAERYAAGLRDELAGKEKSHE